MRRSPLTMGLIYIGLGLLFTTFAIENVKQEGWGFFVYILIILATFDFVSGIKLLSLHFLQKQIKNKK